MPARNAPRSVWNVEAGLQAIQVSVRWQDFQIAGKRARTKTETTDRPLFPYFSSSRQVIPRRESSMPIRMAPSNVRMTRVHFKLVAERSR